MEGLSPEPPFLVIREGLSFWVETRRPEECSATLEAFRDGCFQRACCFDASGGLWPIVDATLRRRPTLLQRLLPWRRARVELRFGPRVQSDVPDVVSRLSAVLRSGSEFTDSLGGSALEILQRLSSARTPGDVIRIARG